MRIKLWEIAEMKNYIKNDNDFDLFYNHCIENDNNDILNNIQNDFMSLINQLIHDCVLNDFNYDLIDYGYYKNEMIEIINGRKNDNIIT